MRQHTSAYVSIRQHTSAYVSMWTLYEALKSDCTCERRSAGGSCDAAEP